ncbi:hypothetical protein MJG53_009313 [Ovis ammon polii x Ovis aries]|uniref:Uncharacterized protein n=1 Tax=Ovis ammon polii x Ovis aries TaxID=2918886 RepID=A0ACB9UWB1_9CETA|nr:hypothetical protein MJG53_009313 [Ovis ammon polii x Ovis aries]
MVPEDRSDGPGAGEESARLQAGPIRKGCDLSADSPPGRLQSHRARIHQQIDRELRMRTGAENLYRATSNARVRETVALELSDVNSSLQLLKEELAGLDSSGDTGQPESEGVTAPMIPLGLKETKPLDWAPSLKELICRHFGEDGASYEAEIRELEELRQVGVSAPSPQATRTPSRSKAGLELLTAYYNQLCFLEARFVTPARSLGLLFHWYDSLTGLPAQQRALAFEKGSVLFNIGALHTQIGARQNRSCPEGISRAMEAFQRAAGAFSLLRENFSHAPSPDMSPASLSMLEKLMSAQAQECVFEGLLLQAPEAAHDCLAQLRLAQEAAQVAAEYRLVHRTMVQPPVQDYVPFPWTTLVHVKAEHFHALAHYHAALGLCDCAPVAESELPILEKVFLASAEARGPVLPQEREERSKLGKAHLRRALLGQEAALQLHAVCRALRWEDLLQAVLARALQRSLAKYSELDLEDDFHEATEAPDVQPKNHWRLVGPIHLSRGEGGFGFTLRGDSPVLIAAVVPGGRAAEAGLKEGDYIVSVNGQPCRWWKHAEVVAQLKGVGDEGVSLQVVTLLPAAELPVSVTCKVTSMSPPQEALSDTVPPPSTAPVIQPCEPGPCDAPAAGAKQGSDGVGAAVPKPLRSRKRSPWDPPKDSALGPPRVQTRLPAVALRVPQVLPPQPPSRLQLSKRSLQAPRVGP